jgi:hypothetical protein
MTTTGLLDPGILAFALTPLIVSVACAVMLVFRHAHEDVPTRVLAWAVSAMPQARKEWGIAMLAELAAVPGRAARWRFALSCARAALFMMLFLPRPETPRDETPRAETAWASGRRPVLGLLAVTLPPLALPFIYIAAAIFDAVGGGPMPLVKLLVVTTMAALVSGVPLGLASRWRRERLPHLSTWGIASSAATLGYFVLGMQWLAGAD